MTIKQKGVAMTVSEIIGKDGKILIKEVDNDKMVYKEMTIDLIREIYLSKKVLSFNKSDSMVKKTSDGEGFEYTISIPISLEKDHLFEMVERLIESNNDSEGIYVILLRKIQSDSPIEDNDTFIQNEIDNMVRIDENGRCVSNTGKLYSLVVF